MALSRKETRNIFKGLAFLSPWLMGFTVFTAAPLGLAIYLSLCDYSLARDGGHSAPLFRGLNNYSELFHDALFWQVLRNSLLYSAMALPAGMLMSLAVAILLNSKLVGQSIFRTIVFVPSLVPSVASAVLWMWLFNQKLGLINNFLGRLGISGPGWISDAHWVLPAFVLMSLWGIGNTVVIYLAGLQDVPRELYEAAELDGAGPLSRMWNVTLPMISPVIFFNLVMAIIGVLQVFDVPYVMTGGGPAHASYFFTSYLYDKAMKYQQFGYASAMAMVQFALVLILTGIAFWSSRKWVHYR